MQCMEEIKVKPCEHKYCDLRDEEFSRWASPVPAVPPWCQAPWFYLKLPDPEAADGRWRCRPADAGGAVLQGRCRGLVGRVRQEMELVLSKVSRDEGLWCGRNVWKVRESE